MNRTATSFLTKKSPIPEMGYALKMECRNCTTFLSFRTGVVRIVIVEVSLQKGASELNLYYWRSVLGSVCGSFSFFRCVKIDRLVF